jgi:hypothetical protein
MIEESNAQFEKDKSGARSFGAIVYVGGVVAATVMFISFVLTAFPEDAYFTRLIMSVAGVTVGCSMLAFPIALHQWTITKQHRKWTTLLYHAEMMIIAINTVVSFVNLLAKYSNYESPEWAVLYEPFSVASIVFTVFAWGTVFLLDPDHQLKANERDADARFAAKIAKKRDEFIDSAEGEDLVVQITMADVMARYDPARYTQGKRHFGTGKPAGSDVVVDPEKGFVKKQLTMGVPVRNYLFRKAAKKD